MFDCKDAFERNRIEVFRRSLITRIIGEKGRTYLIPDSHSCASKVKNGYLNDFSNANDRGCAINFNSRNIFCKKREDICVRYSEKTSKRKLA